MGMSDVCRLYHRGGFQHVLVFFSVASCVTISKSWITILSPNLLMSMNRTLFEHHCFIFLLVKIIIK